MKNIFFFTVIFSTITTNVFCQVKTNYGFKVGIIRSDQNWESSNNADLNNTIEAKRGIKIGIFSEWRLYSHFSIVAELNYSQKGSKVEIDFRDEFGNGNPVDLQYIVDYLEIPLLLKIEFETQRCNIYPIIGARVDCLIYRKAFPIANQSDLKDWIIGYTYGVGIEFKRLFSIPLKLEVRHNPDLSLMYKSNSLEITNSTIDFIIGITL